MSPVKILRKDYPRKCTTSTKLKNVFLVLLCITELMVPSLGAVCGVTDGSAANSVACTCGSVECTSTTGLICFSTYGDGSCRKTGFGGFGYTKEAGNTNCGSESNRKPILDKAACEAAATSMGLDDVEAIEYPYSVWPPGCMWGGNPLGLWYNTLVTSTSSCDGANSVYCLCIAATECTQTNGATSNTDACLCGGTGCTAASGLYCTSSTSTCSSGDPCASVDGSSLNTGINCSCGTAVCNSIYGMFCYASNSQCSLVAIPDCLATDGSVANGATCTCSSATCTAASGLFCTSSALLTNCKDTAVDCKADELQGDNRKPYFCSATIDEASEKGKSCSYYQARIFCYPYCYCGSIDSDQEFADLVKPMLANATKVDSESCTLTCDGNWKRGEVALSATRIIKQKCNDPSASHDPNGNCMSDFFGAFIYGKHSAEEAFIFYVIFPIFWCCLLPMCVCCYVKERNQRRRAVAESQQRQQQPQQIAMTLQGLPQQQQPVMSTLSIQGGNALPVNSQQMSDGVVRVVNPAPTNYGQPQPMNYEQKYAPASAPAPTPMP